MKKLLGLLLFISIALSANAQLLWKISGNGLEKPSYIFGTHHFSSLSIKDSIAAMPQAMNETDQVCGEILMSEMMTPAFAQSMQQQMMMPKDTTLQSLFTSEQYEEIGKVVKDNMMVDIAMLAQLKPTAITQQLTILLYLKHTPGYNPQEQLDTYFQQQAQQQGKKVCGLETAQSQIDVMFNGQTLQRQANLLYCLVSDMDRTLEQSKRLASAYTKQDLDTILQLMEERDGNSCDPLPGEMEAMLDGRNKAWIQKMPAIMTENPTLFVVGAAHLPGDNGVLNLLKQQGYTIEAMK
ncbi:MAG: TraB/GumN family protein [Bacteroides sp.]|nr:TraB/GumN family protein [Bacteroides sp.]